MTKQNKRSNGPGNKEPIVQRTCNMCNQNMENAAEVMARNGKPAYIGICCNPACPSYGLLQIAAEQMPKETRKDRQHTRPADKASTKITIDVGDIKRRLSEMRAFLKKHKESE